MKRSILLRFALVASLWLVGPWLISTPVQADEPAKTEPPTQTQAENERINSDLQLLHSRLNLANQINQLADFDVHVGLTHANALGVDVALPDAALKAQLNLAEREGVTVTQVPDESVGAKAGLKVHDVIIQVGDHRVGEIADLAQALEAVDGKSVKLKLWRAGKQTELEATPKKPEYARLKLSKVLFSDLDRDVLVSAEHFRIGVTLSEADDTLRQQLRLATGEGLVVTEVLDDSSAAKAGIQVHDVLTMLDGKRLTTVEAINAQIQELKDKSVELRLLRSGKEVTLQIAARKSQEAAFTDQTMVVWGSKNCQSCHGDAAHRALAWKLNANQSAWTDGHTGKLFLREWIGDKAAGSPTAPQQQIEALKNQLAEMQKTLAELEQVLQQPVKDPEKEPAKEEDKK